MKKIIFIIIMMALMVGSAEAGRVDNCFWIWDTAVTGANAAPNDVYCDSTWNNTFTSKGATHIQSTTGAYSVQIQWDTLFPDGSNTIGDLHSDITDTQVICANTSTTSDINVRACFSGTCDTGTGTSAYYQEDNIGNDLVDTFELTPVGGGFKLTQDEDGATNGCLVVRTTVVWE